MTCVVLFFLSGCTTINKPATLSVKEQGQWLNDPQALSEQYARMFDVERFRLDAKLSVSVDDKRDSANLIWQSDSQEKSKLTLFGAFGAGATTLEIGEGWARATDSKGRQYEDSDPQRLLYKLTGWVVPVRELRFWLFGLAYPNAAMRYRLDQQGAMLELQQSDWLIEYRGAIAAGDRLLPKRLVMQSRQLNQEIAIKLVSKKWQIN
jgi:outer membrane lipoprotein LolB